MELDAYNNQAMGFSMTFPKGWLKQETVSKQGYNLSFSTGELDEMLPPDKQPASLTMSIFGIHPEMDLDKFTRFYSEQFEHILPTIKATSTPKPTTFGGNQGMTMEHSAKLDNGELCFYQIFSVRKNFAYVMGFTANPSDYLQLRAIVDSCVAKFKFTGDVNLDEMPAPTELETLALKTFQNEELGFSFNYPADAVFKVARTKTTGILCVYQADFKLTKDKKEYPLQILVTAQQMPPGTTMESFEKSLMRHLDRRMLSKLMCNAINYTNSNGLSTRLVSYKDTITGRKTKSSFFVRNNKAIVITFSSAALDEDLCSQQYCARILDSLKIVAPGTRPNPPSVVTLEHLSYLFSIAYDTSRWTIQDVSGPMVVTLLDSSAQYEPFAPNITVLVNPVAPGTSLNQMLDLVQSQLSSMGATRTLSSEDIVLAGQPAKAVVTLTKLPPELVPMAIEVKAMHRLLIVEHTAYFISYSITSNKSWDRSALDVLSSFKLLSMLPKTS